MLDKLFGGSFHMRGPRHDALPDNSSRVTVEVSGGQDEMEATLVNLSRHGVQLRIPGSIPVSSQLQLELASETTGPVCRQAMVCWRNPVVDGDGWLVGCELDEEIEWETLGGLFLDRVLRCEPP